MPSPVTTASAPLTVEATGEHAEAIEDGLLGGFEERVRPVDGRSERLVALDAGATAAGEEPEALVDVRGDLAGVHRPDACGRRARWRGGCRRGGGRSRRPRRAFVGLEREVRRGPIGPARRRGRPRPCVRPSRVPRRRQGGRANAPRMIRSPGTPSPRGSSPGSGRPDSRGGSPRPVGCIRRAGARSCRARAAAALARRNSTMLRSSVSPRTGRPPSVDATTWAWTSCVGRRRELAEPGAVAEAGEHLGRDLERQAASCRPRRRR